MNFTKRGIIAKLAVVAIISTSNAVRGEDVTVQGFDDSIKKSIIYYNSFSNKDTAVADKSKFEVTVQHKPKQSPDKGISGRRGIAIMGKRGLSLKSEKLSAHNTRTYSFWFYFDEKLKQNGKGTFISSNGMGPHKTWNFVSVFVRGATWAGLKDSAGVSQVWGFNKLSGKQKIFDKEFRENYPEKRWHHFALTVDGGEKFSTYLDGKQVAVLTLLKRPLNIDDNLRFVNIAAGWEVLTMIDDLIIFDISLSAEQIKDYYTANHAMLKRTTILSR